VAWNFMSVYNSSSWRTLQASANYPRTQPNIHLCLAMKEPSPENGASVVHIRHPLATENDPSTISHQDQGHQERRFVHQAIGEFVRIWVWNSQLFLPSSELEACYRKEKRKP
jgi:hypothetical protein